jgi:dihydrofolate reductase
MGRLIYLMNVSADGYVEDANGSIDWGTVDEELHSWFNDRTREMQASIYGRRMYEVMSGHWPTAEADPASTDVEREFARIWVGLPKIVFSTTLKTVEGNSRLVSGDVAEELAKLRSEFDGDIDVSGPTIASAFIERGLVDEYGLVVHPVIVGGGKPFFPKLDRPITLRPGETRTFSSGVRYLSFTASRARGASTACGRARRRDRCVVASPGGPSRGRER